MRNSPSHTVSTGTFGGPLGPPKDFRGVPGSLSSTLAGMTDGPPLSLTTGLIPPQHRGLLGDGPTDRYGNGNFATGVPFSRDSSSSSSRASQREQRDGGREELELRLRPDSRNRHDGWDEKEEDVEQSLPRGHRDGSVSSGGGGGGGGSSSGYHDHHHSHHRFHGGSDDRSEFHEQREHYREDSNDGYHERGGYEEDYNGYHEGGGGGYRGRGRGRSDWRGRGRGRGSRFSDYIEEYHEEPGGGGGYRGRAGGGGYRGRGGFRGRGFRGGGAERGAPPPAPAPAEEWGGEPPEGTPHSVEILNLPPNASYKAVRELFRGIYVPNDSIKLLADDQGNRIGVALLKFTSPVDALEATLRTGGYVYDAQVEVNLIEDHKYEDEFDVTHLYRAPEAKGSSPCVCVTGLPTGRTEVDVAKLFSRASVQDIVLELDSKGNRQPTGRAFVRLGTPEEAFKAVQSMRKLTMDQHLLRVEHCPSEVMLTVAKNSNLRGPAPAAAVVKTSAEPRHQNQKQDVKEVPAAAAAKPNPASLAKNDSKADEKVKEKVEVKKLDPSDVPLGADLLTDCVAIRDVPSGTDEAAIRDFFSDEGLVPEKVFFNTDDTGPLTTVYVVFPDIVKGKHAQAKNNQQLGQGKVSVELIAKPVVMNAMGLPFDPLELLRKGQNSTAEAIVSSKVKPEGQQSPRKELKSPEEQDRSQSPAPQQPPPLMSSPPRLKVSDGESLAQKVLQDPNLSIQQKLARIADMNIPGLNASTALASISAAAVAVAGNGSEPRSKYDSHRSSLEPLPLSLSLHPYGGPRFRPRGPRPSLRMQMRSGQMDSRPHRSSMHRLPRPQAAEPAEGLPTPPENFGSPGCVVALGNVPYRATTEDIVEFFSDFKNLRPENVIRRYNEFNQPTADARVALPTPQDAKRAVQLLNRQFLHNRSIFVSIVQE